MGFNGWSILSLALLAFGVGFWIYMGTTSQSPSPWTDVGVYAVAMTLAAFGIAGLLASASERDRTA